MQTQTDRAIKELQLAELFNSDSPYDGNIGKAVEELLIVFQKQSHSGMSASIVSSIFNKIATGGILTPLKGTKDEWHDTHTMYDSTPDDKPLFQNIRYSTIFAIDDVGTDAYDIHGIIFEDPSGATFTSGDSRIPVTFPYTPPKPIFTKVDYNGNPIEEQ